MWGGYVCVCGGVGGDTDRPGHGDHCAVHMLVGLGVCVCGGGD